MSEVRSEAPVDEALMRSNDRFPFRGDLYPYQEELFSKARGPARRYIVHLPTGGGKTVIAARLAAESLNRDSTEKKVVMLVNRVPLVRQQQAVMMRHIPNARVAGVAGDKKDANSWIEVLHNFNIVVIIDSIFFMWTLQNVDLWDDVGLLIFDEVHNARKNSYFAKIAKQYMSRDPVVSTPLRVVGLTASPGADVTELKTRQNIVELMQLTGCQIVAVTEQIEDLTARVRVPRCFLKEFQLVPVEAMIELEIVDAIRDIENNVVRGVGTEHTFTAAFSCVGMPIGGMQYAVRCAEIVAQGRGKGDEALINTGLALQRLNEALILLSETGVKTCLESLLGRHYIGWVFTPVNSSNPHVRHIHRQLGNILCPFWYRVYLDEAKWVARASELSTKMMLLIEVIKSINEDVNSTSSREDFRGIVFCQTKKGAHLIVRHLASSDVSWLNPRMFVGHSRTLVDECDAEGNTTAKAISMTDAQQQECLQEFRSGRVKLLVATSVAEEGLDIPSCNIIIRFDGEMTVKSFIQTRGRARKAGSQYFALMRTGAEATSFRAACNSVVVQERVVRQLCSDAMLQPQSGVPFGARVLHRWEHDPTAVIQRLETSTWLRQKVEQSIADGMTGKVVTFRLKLDHDDYAGYFEVIAKGVGQLVQARRIAAWWTCRLLHYALGKPVDALLDHNSVSNNMRTMHIHNATPTSASAVVASVQSPLIGDGVEELTRYVAHDWQKMHPFQVLQKEMLNGRLPAVTVSEDKAIGQTKVAIKYLHNTTRQMREVEAQRESYVAALGDASLIALKDLGKPQVRAPRSTQFLA